MFFKTRTIRRTYENETRKILLNELSLTGLDGQFGETTQLKTASLKFLNFPKHTNIQTIYDI